MSRRRCPVGWRVLRGGPSAPPTPPVADGTWAALDDAVGAIQAEARRLGRCIGCGTPLSSAYRRETQAAACPACLGMYRSGVYV